MSGQELSNAGTLWTRTPGQEPDTFAVRLPVAERISGFSRSALYKFASEGKLTFRKYGSTVMVDYAELKRLFESLPKAVIRIAGHTPEEVGETAEN